MSNQSYKYYYINGSWPLEKGKLCNNYSGFTIIEILVSISLISMSMAALMAIFSIQTKEMKAMEQKSEILELKNQILLSFYKSDVCSWQMKDKQIDSSTATTTVASPTVLPLSQIYQGLDNSSLLLIKAGEKLQFSNTGLIVDKIEFKEFIQTGVPNQLNGVIEVSFKRESLVRSIKPLRILQKIKTITSAGIDAIDSCLSPYSISSAADDGGTEPPPDTTAPSYVDLGGGLTMQWGKVYLDMTDGNKGYRYKKVTVPVAFTSILSANVTIAGKNRPPGGDQDSVGLYVESSTVVRPWSSQDTAHWVYWTVISKN